MTNIRKLENDLDNTVSSLSAHDLAEHYFNMRKRCIKLVNEGKCTQARKLFNKNNKFYDTHSIKNPELFHEYQHKFIDWFFHYTCFREFQAILALAERDKKALESELKKTKNLKKLFKEKQKEIDNKELDKLLNQVETIIKELNNKIKNFSIEISEIEAEIEKNKDFILYNFFEEVDPIGYKNINWIDWINSKEKICYMKGDIYGFL